MLENKKFVRKIGKIIIMIMMAILMLLKCSITLVAIDLGSGIINPIYKPVWEIEKDANGKQKVYIDKANKKITITVKGLAYESGTINSNVGINYASGVTSTLSTADIDIFIDGADVTDRFADKATAADQTLPMIEVTEGEIIPASQTESGKAEIRHNIVLYNFEESVRQAGKTYKEYSGNIALKIDGRGKDSSTYLTGDNRILYDQYGNQNMMETDQNGTNADGTWIDVRFDNAKQDKMTAIGEDSNGDGLISVNEDTNGNGVLDTGEDINGNNILDISEDEDANGNGTLDVGGNITTTTPVYMFTDFIHPEFTYKYATTDIGNMNNGDTKIVKFEFEVTDKYFKETKLTADDLTIRLIDESLDIPAENITKTLTKTHYVIMKADGTVSYQTVPADGSEYVLQTGESKIGEKFLLVISGLEQKHEYTYTDSNGNIVTGLYSDGKTYSGPMSIGFPTAETQADGTLVKGVIDKSGNVNNPAVITIGVDETDGNDENGDSGNQEVIDVVDPIWEKVSASIADGTITIKGTDKYFDRSTIDINNIGDSIKVYVNGTVSNVVGKSITRVEELTNGIQYTIQLSNLYLESDEYVDPFTPTNPPIVGGTATYKKENGGYVTIEMVRGTIVDESGNENEPIMFEMGNSDSTQLEVFEVQQTHDADANTVTTIFNVTDRNYDKTDFITTSDLEVWIDGTKVDGLISDESALTYIEINTPFALDGQDSKTVGHQYTLVLSNVREAMETFTASGREYQEYSGTIEIKINKDAAKDSNGNTIKPSTDYEGNELDVAIIDGFEDYIKPNVLYKEQYQNADESEKSYTLKFDVTDKYLYYPTTAEITAGQTNQFKLDDLTITMQNGQYKQKQNADGSWEFELDGDGNKIPIIYDLVEEAEKGLIDLSFADTEIVNGGRRTRTSDTTEIRVDDLKATNRDTNLIEDVDNYLVGHSYTLKVSKLEQLGIVEGNTTLDYSGVITVTIDSGKIKDTSGNTNNSKTITSQIDISGEGIVEQVDVIDPLVEKVTTSAYAVGQTATIKLRVTDTYFVDDEDIEDDESTLTSDEIKVVVDGEVVDSITPVLSSPTILSEQRVGIEQVQYGIEYTVTIDGYATNANQVKVRVLADSILDKSNNGNKETELIVYNVLRETNTETAQTSVFLGGPIQRQKVEKVIFKTLTRDEMRTWSGKVGTDNSYWDVSAQRDKSIVAHYTGPDSNGAYEVTIGSFWEIFANQDSSYLFSYIGSDSSCDSTIAITGIELLNEESVTNMSYMFNNFGARVMTTLDLGTFKTSNVTNMAGMFNNCGNLALTSLNIGSEFNTSNVTDMSNMFNGCGQALMTNLYFGTTTGIDEGVITLPDNFNTAKVQNMSGMFQNFGATKVKTLNLGNSFYTSEVTDMSNMFNGCSQSELTSFTLGTNFNTTKVQNMSGMFQNFAYKLETLNLGTKFYTSAVTDMSNMFNGCGQTSMKTLTLGGNFNTSAVTNMSGMFQDFAKSSTVMTGLDLENLFYTTSATNMSNMFNGCGNTAMTALDLGPAFTTIASTNTDIFTNCGIGSTVVYAPESIYSNRTAFKLNSTSTATPITYTKGTINPIYRPEWRYDSSSLDIKAQANLEDSTISIVLKGNANKTKNDGVKIEYTSNVTTALTKNDITVYVNGVEANWITKALPAGEPATAAEVTQTLTLSGFEEEARRNGIPFKEWSGNISIRIGGRGQATSTYAANKLVDVYGNQSMMATDEVDGTWIDVIFKDDEIDRNTNGKMFTDFIKPEITYRYAQTLISNGNNGDTKKVTLSFDMTDKYFNNTTMTADDIILKLIDTDPATTIDPADITKTLTKTHYIIMKADGTVAYEAVPADGSEYTLQTGESKVGEKYQLLIEGLEQKDENGFSTGNTYSGPMSVSFPADLITDKSGNKNNLWTITIGVDETDGNEDTSESGSQVIVDVVDPAVLTVNGLSIQNDVSTIDKTNKSVEVVIEGYDKYLDTSVEKQHLLKQEIIDKIKVRIIEHDGDIIEDASATELKLIKADGTIITDQTQLNEQYGTTRIGKNVEVYLGSQTNKSYRINLTNFGEVFEGKVSLIIPDGSFEDKSGNKNVDTEVFVGNATSTDAFKDSIVDFRKPTWNYATSRIDRDRNDIVNDAGDYVTIKIIGHDNYYASNSLTKEVIDVYIKGTKNTDIIKDLQPITDETELTTLATQAGLGELVAARTITDVVCGYTLTIKNFGINEEQVNIVIPQNTILDTSNNGNIDTTIYVGNPEWVENNEPLETTDSNYPAFDAFRTIDNGDGTVSGSIVDFVKPVIELGTATLNRDRTNTNNSTATITFDATDRNYASNYTENLDINDIQIFVDTLNNERNVTNTITKSLDSETISKTVNGKVVTGYRYTLTLSGFDKGIIDSDIFARHSGVIKLIIGANQVADTSGNKNNTTTLIVNDFIDGENNIGVADFVKPMIYSIDKSYVDWEDKFALITLRATDRFYSNTADNILEPGDITLYEEYKDASGNTTYRDITSRFASNIQVIKSPALTDFDGNIVGYDYTIRLDGFEEELKLKIAISAGVIGDTSENYNDAYTLANGTAISAKLDNKRPYWRYVSADTSEFHSQGKLSFTVKGMDKFLNFNDSLLEYTETVKDLKLLLDGEVVENPNITVTHIEDVDEDTMRYETYQIDITGLNVDAIGTYSLIFAKDTLVDEDGNKSAATTISFSKSMISYDSDNHNTNNYTNVTYHISPDQENVHSSNVHELMSVNTTGTNYNTTTYRPSTIGEIFNNGENPSFTESIYDPEIAADGYTVNYIYSPKSFAGWAEADADGTPIYYEDATLETVSEEKTAFMRIFSLYDDIPNTITNLRAILQDATVVFVANGEADSNASGLPVEAIVVNDIETAYSRLDSSGTAENNIIVIVDPIEWNGSTTLNKNATITSVYAGVDYRINGAELKISKNMIVNGDITFDNIKLYSNSETVSNGNDYLGKGTYTNMLISNYSGDITLGRGITTLSGQYTFGAIIGGNYKTQTSTGNLGTHTIRVEAGKYNNIIAGSALEAVPGAETSKFITHEVVIGNMRDTAIPRNTKLTITGYVAIGENENACYPNGATGASDSYDKPYANVTLYSGTLTGDNKFKKATENAVIYARSINGKTEGKVVFEMYGGIATGNIYAGARYATENIDSNCNTMNFYGGELLTGDIFGQGATDAFTGSATITLQGQFKITTGNVFGGSNATTAGTGNGTGNTIITISSSSVTVNGNIYGGSNGVNNSGYITGTTSITLNTGNVANIYGSGNNSGNSGTITITVNNGGVSENIVGGAYNGQSGNSTITVLGGTVEGNIYGGNENTAESYLTNDNKAQNVTITIGDTDTAKAPTINGDIFGSGKFDKVGTVEIQLIECLSTPTVYGGSAETNGTTNTVNIYLNGMTVTDIYGGGKSAGTVTTSNIYLQSGTVLNEVYGGGNGADVETSNISLEGIVVDDVEYKATVGSIYGGSNTSGTVTTSNITLKSGNLTHIYGGGNSADVGTTYVTLDGIEIDNIYGGSKDSGTTTETNITLKSGTVRDSVFGGGLDSTVGETNIKQEGATVKSIYGGNNNPGTGDGGNAGATNIEIFNSIIENVYGGNKDKGTTSSSNITIHGTTSKVTGKLYGGGYKSNIGTAENLGSTTINIAGGTIEGDIYGGSETAEGKVYGKTNINIGKDVVDSTLTPGNIEIKGNIYGAGSTTNSDYSYVSVVGDTFITIDESADSPITFSGSIFGAGKGSTYSTHGTDNDKSMVHIIDLGTAEETHQLVSIERTGNLYIGKSFIEFFGRQDANNADKIRSYSLNRITKALTIYDSTTLYTRRGFNMVGGFNSYKGIYDYGEGVIAPTAKATATVTTSGVTTNTDNRLYTFEGVNLIFVKEEGDIYQKANADDNIWGDVNGMAFFGMYALDRDNGQKVYDIYAPGSEIYLDSYTGEISSEKFFANGTFVEGKHKDGHVITIDGFYTNVATYEDTVTVKPQIISVVDGGNYYDWIINEDIVNYSANLIASISGEQSMADIVLNQKYAPNATYQLDEVSLNALNIDIDLINPLEIPLISTEAHNKLGLTMRTDNTGWLNKAETNIYTANDGSFVGDDLYKTDETTTPGTIRFKLYNSVNITQTKDLGFVNLVLIGKTPESADGTVPANTFKVVIALNLHTKAEEQNQNYVPRFTNSIEKELSYTQDSKVDLTYTLYKETTTTPYEAGDYRVLETSVKLPAGTRITMKDYVTEKVYYYHVTGTETEYKLSNFIEMDSTTIKYTDNNSTYFKESQGGIPAHAVEKYDISIDFIGAVDYIDESAVQSITQQTYLKLKNSSGIKLDNGGKEIKYNLYSGKNALVTEIISNAETSYSVVEALDIPFTLDASILEQGNIMDTKYYDQIAGISLQIVDENGSRIKSPELQNFKIVNNDTGESFSANSTGVIRMPIMETLSTIKDNYTLTIEQDNVAPGEYTCLINFYTADDGKYYGTTPLATQKFYITFISKLLGSVGVEATNGSRIISKATGENLEGNNGVDMKISVAKPTSSINIRVELFKRDATYTITEGSSTYNGISYTPVDISRYLQGTWEKPSEYGLTAENENEYMILPKQDYGVGESPELKVIELERAIKSGISTGEYKLVFKAYSDNTLVQTTKKTFIVTQ